MISGEDVVDEEGRKIVSIKYVSSIETVTSNVLTRRSIVLQTTFIVTSSRAFSLVLSIPENFEGGLTCLIVITHFQIMNELRVMNCSFRVFFSGKTLYALLHTKWCM